MDNRYKHKRTCEKCGQVKPSSEFKKSGGAICRKCRNAMDRERYHAHKDEIKRKRSASRTELPIILPVVCPCGARIYKPTNGVWLCPDCAPDHHASLNVPIYGRISSNCYNCRYQLLCSNRVQQGQPILCEAYLQEERNLFLHHFLKSHTFVFTNT